MKRLICILVSLLLVLSMGVTALAAEFELDRHYTAEGMHFSWYQGYEPTVSYHTMTLYLPVRGKSCVGSIRVSIALEDPHVFLLAGEPKEVTVSPKDGVYPVKLTLPLQRSRRNGDYPATITLKGVDGSGKEITETIPYVIRIRDGLGSHETMEPVITDVVGDLNVGSDGSLSLTITNPTTTQSIMAGEITVTDGSGEILMSGSGRIKVPEILPGKTETVTVPMTVMGHAAVRTHRLEVVLRCQVLGREAQWSETFTVPVTQEIRLEQGGVQLPAAVAGELSDLTLPLMNMGKGNLRNVLVKLEMEGVLETQSVLVGTVAPGESRQARLTFTPKVSAVGTHTGTVTVTCEDDYGNTFRRELEVVLTVEEPIPEADLIPEEEKPPLSLGTLLLLILCASMAAGLVLQGALLTRKIHNLEEDRL